MWRVALRFEATSNQLVDDDIVSSRSFASSLHRPSHAKVRSTTQRLAMTTKPVALFGLRTISIVGPGSRDRVKYFPFANDQSKLRESLRLRINACSGGAAGGAPGGGNDSNIDIDLNGDSGNGATQ